MRRILPTLLIALVVGGAAGAFFGHRAAPSTVVAPIPQTASATSDTTLTPAALYKRDAPGVTVITATTTKQVAPTLFTPAQTEKEQSLGSGFVIDTKGDVVTNDHVVAGASGIRVGFGSGSTYPAKVVGADPGSDLAVVHVNAPSSALHPLAFDSSSAVVPGDPVYAIGNPFGLDRTMTAGIVSAIGRDIQAPNGLTIPNSIQTDAPINHGNSGGPLLDAAGHVVGVNAQIEGGTVNANVGVGFAIPSDTVRSIAQQLISSGKVEHAFIGVQVETIPTGVSKMVRGIPSSGVTVAKVTAGSPAAHAGLRAATHQVTADGQPALVGGDSITALDGKPIRSAQNLADAVAPRKPGDHITLTVVRGGATRTVSLTLGAASQST